ncbi:DUF58 domain-containing protein [Rathayibacter festucae]|uniref:DUF58 domain-containing protein n=1 Tax=Rathayibacter festucae TaxID=110937 RepID=UPI002A6AD085|nr:DUF58 domain-containing protein [Rathayibacter festucae]MDY0915008.1 DUF58 domain-containing protein [Rathayibacter festucae]
MTGIGVLRSEGLARRAGAVVERSRHVVETAGVLLAPVRARAVPVVAVATSFAWVLLALAGLAWIVGAVQGWSELVLVAVLALAVLLVAAPFMIGRSSYAVDLDLAATRVVAGERAVGRVEVRNASNRSLLPARVELPVGGGLAVFPLPRLEATAVHEELFTIPTARRGVIRVGPVRSVRGDGLGLFRRVVPHTVPGDLFVHPRTVAVGGSSSGFLKDLEGRPAPELSNNDVSFHALRAYAPGDDRRYVHWKTTARTGTLMVRQFEETRRSHLAIGLSLDPADYRDDEQFELAVSSCASLGLQALREGQQLSVLVQGRSLHAGLGKRLLDDLSGVELGQGRGDLVGLSRSLARSVPQASVVILVVGSEVTAARFRSAARQLPPDARAIGLSCDEERPAARRSIGELALLSVPALEELPATVRRGAA